jgi:hypothetical protein
MMIILGNAVSMIGCMVMVLIGFLRKKEQILMAQCVQFGFLSAGNLILGGMTGFISGVVSIARNLVFAFTGGSLGWKIGFIILQTMLTFLPGWPGLLGCLPLISGVILTWFLDAKSDVQFKLAIIVAQVTWVIYDWSYRNYVAFAFDIFTILSNLSSMLMIYRNEHNQKAPLL